MLIGRLPCRRGQRLPGILLSSVATPTVARRDCRFPFTLSRAPPPPTLRTDCFDSCLPTPSSSFLVGRQGSPDAYTGDGACIRVASSLPRNHECLPAVFVSNRIDVLPFFSINIDGHTEDGIFAIPTGRGLLCLEKRRLPSPRVVLRIGLLLVKSISLTAVPSSAMDNYNSHGTDIPNPHQAICLTQMLCNSAGGYGFTELYAPIILSVSRF